LNRLSVRIEALGLNRSISEDSFPDFIDRQTRSKNVILFYVPDVPNEEGKMRRKLHGMKLDNFIGNSYII
jgi:hypothetical protein